MLLTFNRLKTLIPEESADKEAFITDAVKESTTVVVSEDKKSVRRANALPDEDKSVQQTVFAKTLPLDAQLEEVQACFAAFGEVLMVRMRRGADKKFNGTVFVEFGKPEFAEAASGASEVSSQRHHATIFS